MKEILYSHYEGGKKMISNKIKIAGLLSLATAMLLGAQVSAAHVEEPWENKDGDVWKIRSDFEFDEADELKYDELYHIQLSNEDNDLDLYRFVPTASGSYTFYVSDEESGFLIGVLDYDAGIWTNTAMQWYSYYEGDEKYDFVKGRTYYIFAWTCGLNAEAEYDIALIDYKGEGNPYAGWRRMDGYWFYMYENGTYAKGWAKIDDKWYFFNEDKEMQTGWVKDSGKWYYLKSSGEMATGWVKYNGSWYYLQSSGAMATGWIKDNGNWYFLKSSGEMAESEYCNGYWLDAGGKWTYTARASWKKDSKGWYYQDTNGWYAKNATYKIDGKNYNFDSAGYCTNP